MSLLDPIVPALGPFGLALAASDTIVIMLGLVGLVSLALYFVKKDIFETSKAWVGATVVLSLLTILFRGMEGLCSCSWYYDPSTGQATQLVPLTYLLITGSFFAIIYNFNIPVLKKWKWMFSIPLSIPIALFSSIFFPLMTLNITPGQWQSIPSAPWVFIETLLLAPVGAIYSTFTFEKSVLHMGDYRARMQRFFEQANQKKQPGAAGEMMPADKGGFSYYTYGLLGSRILKVLPFFKGLKQILMLAGMKVGYKAYVSLMVFAAMLAGAVSFIVWLLLLNPVVGGGYALGLGFASDNWLFTILTSMLLAVLVGAATLGFFYALPFFRLGSRRQRLDQYLPFTASYMTVLASAGVTPERILRSTSEKDPKFMLSDEIGNVVGRVDLLGFDIIHALNAEVERSPSTAYQDLLRGFAGVIRTGGDMKKFFQGITEHFFQKRHLSVQSFLDTLGIIAETYVLMLIAFPLMLVVMLSIMASIGGSLGGVDVFSFMYLLAFILIPICGVMFLFLLDTMQPKG